MKETIKNKLTAAGYNIDDIGIYRSGRGGYWSNLNRDENKEFIDSLQQLSPIETVRNHIPHLTDMIFSPKREAALELLGPLNDKICIDYGCMWGALSIGLTKRGASVLAIDQTYDSLRFLQSRIKQENFHNVICLEDDIRNVVLDNFADIAVVNGVLEWIPEFGDIELKKYYGKKKKKEYRKTDPQKLQTDFLKIIFKNLRNNGQLLLAIENRYALYQFIGEKDLHSNLYFTSVLPRKLANFISYIYLKRPYVNYLYSFPQLKQILQSIGFSEVTLYMAFPDYRFPELILPYEKGIHFYGPYPRRKRTLKSRAARVIEFIFMKYLKARFFAPAIIAIARK